MFFIIILDDSPDVQKDINCLILYLLVLVIQQFVKHSENLVSRLILLFLRTFFLHELDQWDELFQEGNFNLANLTCQNVKRHDQTVDEEALFNFVRKVHETLREI